jgi:hypothetical protein
MHSIPAATQDKKQHLPDTVVRGHMNNIPAKSKKQEANLRRYEAIWLAIKSKQPGEVVDVRCHPSAVKTIIQAVKKEKTKDVAVKKKIGMLCAGPMVITNNPEFDPVSKKPTGLIIISFKLQWDGTKL